MQTWRELIVQPHRSDRRRIQKQFVEYMQTELTIEHKIDELLDGENMQDLMAWLDSL